MNKIKAFLGYTIAIISIFVVLSTFMGMNIWMNMLINLTNIKVSPLYTGGDIYKSIVMDGYEIKIHKPVFQGFLGETKEGFVQIDWIGKNIPYKVSQDVDYNNDNKKDFKIIYETKNEKCKLVKYNSNIISIRDTYVMKEGYAIRINLKNTNK